MTKAAPTVPRPFRKERGRIREKAGRLLWPRPAYAPYRLSCEEAAGGAVGGALLGAVVGWLFFRRAAGLMTALPAAYLTLRVMLRKKESRSRRTMTLQLRDYLLSVTAFLRAGYALENAMIGAEGELRTMHGEGMMTAEAALMSRRLRLRIPPEQLWREFGERCGIPEGEQLARVFAVAKRQGGDYLPVLLAMARAMDARRSLREEIETLLAAQRLEYFIMCLIPAAILFYLNMTSPELTAHLYSPEGRMLMAGVLLFYAGAVLLGDRILEAAYGG